MIKLGQNFALTHNMKSFLILCLYCFGKSQNINETYTIQNDNAMKTANGIWDLSSPFDTLNQRQDIQILVGPSYTAPGLSHQEDESQSF